MSRAVRIACYLVTLAMFIGAGGYLLFGRHKGVGIFLVLLTAVLSRVLILNIAEQDADPPN